MLEQSVSTQEISSHDEGHRILEQSELIQEMSSHDEGHGMLDNQKESTKYLITIKVTECLNNQKEFKIRVTEDCRR